MKPLGQKISTAALSVVFLASCVSIPKDAGFSQLAELTAPMMAAPAEWVGESISEQAASDRISALLSEPLNEASVAELTVLSNRDLRSVLYGLKAARGDYRDAASLPNPFISALFIDGVGTEQLTDCFGTVGQSEKVPIGGSIGIAYDILDLLFFPRTLKAAKADFNAAKYGSVRQFSEFTYEAKLSFYEALAARQMLELATQSHKATVAARDTALALYEAGNIPKVELSREKLFEAQMRAELIQAERHFNMAERKLVQAMGLPKDKADSIKLEGRLRTPDKAELNALDLSTIMTRNLELLHREAIMTSAGKKMGLSDVQSFIGDLEIEAERERHDGEIENSFGGSFELPIFNWGQGKRQANRARMEMMGQGYVGAKEKLATTSDILYGELVSARQGVLLQRKEILPLSNEVLKGTQLDYNAMQIGVFDLLSAKRNQLAAGQAYIASLEDYWKTRAAYEYLLAGGTPGVASSGSGGMMSAGPSNEAGGH